MRSSGRSFGSAFWMKSSGSPSTGEVGVLREDLERLLRRAEGVHQHERQLDAPPLAQREHLQGDDVEEGQAVPDLERRLRAGHAHAGAEAAVELDDGGLRQRRAGLLVGDLHLAEGLDVAERLDGVLRDRSLRPGLQLLEVVREDTNGLGSQATLAHQVDGSVQGLVSHGHHLTMGSMHVWAVSETGSP